MQDSNNNKENSSQNTNNYPVNESNSNPDTVKSFEPETLNIGDLIKDRQDYIQNPIQKMWIATIIFILLIIILYFGFKFFYKTPTCQDNKQNQNEKGVDCGGICNLQCYGMYNDIKIKQSQIIQNTGSDDILIVFENDNINFGPQNISFNINIVYANDEIQNLNYDIAGSSDRTIPFIYRNKTGKNIKSFDIIIHHNQNKFYPILNRKEIPVKSFIVDKVPSGYRFDFVYQNIYKYTLTNSRAVIVLYNIDDKILFADYVNINALERDSVAEETRYSFSDLENAVRAEIYMLEQNFEL